MRPLGLVALLLSFLLPACRGDGALAAGATSVPDRPAPAAGALAPAAGDLDARLLPWATLRRLALLAGMQPPVDEPISRGELAAILEAAAGDGALAAGGDGDGPGQSASLVPQVHGPAAGARATARVLAGWSGRGGLQPGGGGLAWAPGWNLVAEGSLEASRGGWWAALVPRFAGRAGPGAGDAARGDPLEPLAWPGWDPATGPAGLRRAQALGDGATLDLARAVVGRQAGGWSLSLGWDPRRHGPGLGGALLVDRDGPPFAALTVRRTQPLRWPGALAPLGPQALLLRVGRLDEREVVDEGAGRAWRARPWFFQWLARWRLTGWARLGFTHAAIAVPRHGTLWPDLLQISFPTAGVTWDETRDGPLTDRLFSAQLEFRWRHAPRRGLPFGAGRAWWEYAGTDFLPRGPGGLLPEIAAPASIAGVELVGREWDLAGEYAETLHPLVLWYANSSFPGGYAHRGWLLGPAMGGAAERLSVLLRRRHGGIEAELGLGRTEWGAEGHAPALARERHAWLAAAPLRGGAPGPWRARLDWRRTESLSPSGGAARRWWAASLERRF